MITDYPFCRFHIKAGVPPAALSKKVIVSRAETHLLSFAMKEMKQHKIPISVHLFQSGISCDRPLTSLDDTMG